MTHLRHDLSRFVLFPCNLDVFVVFRRVRITHFPKGENVFFGPLIGEGNCRFFRDLEELCLQVATMASM